MISGQRAGEDSDSAIEGYPVSGVSHLQGRMPAGLAQYQGELLAYGFNGQRIAIPSGEIGAVKVYRRFGMGWGMSGSSLVVLDTDGGGRLRAAGGWELRVGG